MNIWQILFLFQENFEFNSTINLFKKVFQEPQESWVQSMSWENPLEEEMATHSSILAWRIPWTEGPGKLQCRELQRVATEETQHAWVKQWALARNWRSLNIFSNFFQKFQKLILIHIFMTLFTVYFQNLSVFSTCITKCNEAISELSISYFKSIINPRFWLSIEHPS